MMGSGAAEPIDEARGGKGLSAELARGLGAGRAVVPVLRHLLASDAPSLVSEAVVARVRGTLDDLACQLYHGARLPNSAPASGAAGDAIAALAARLAADEGLLAHLHSLALEAQLAEAFEARLALDPVLSPLLQELIASDDPVVAELAMSTLAAQTRFLQYARRMELPLAELPADLLGTALALGEAAGIADAARAGLAALKAGYDEAATRIGLMERLMIAMRRAVVASLAFDRSGLALFASGLAASAGCPRRAAVLACHEAQSGPLALALRAAGLELPEIERQLRLISAVTPAACEAAALPVSEARRRLAEGLAA